MDASSERNEIFVRVDPDEDLMKTVLAAAQTLDLSYCAIVSGVGMLKDVTFGFFDTEIDSYRTRRMSGVLDVSVITGNVVRGKDGHVAHIHVVANDKLQQTYSGHLVEATCHITMELFLSRVAIKLERVKLPDHPATRLIRLGEDG